ncbi:hypothetical protein COU37_02700 [Candidatus Micrarchaeota archaeon CG10_big_fil_rev_8_21_14_0_10_45_29]|nr:MAG: hypothetical protein COU37_02700 [Candidatus Micrarchaeota archaeon CG10_big_fil_rev_8_21_14_0_10_45_29]
MASIRKEILVGGNSHHVSVDSSLDLEGVEITGICPQSGKLVHICLSPLLKSPEGPQIPSDITDNAPTPSMDMFSADFASGVQEEAKKDEEISQGQMPLGEAAEETPESQKRRREEEDEAINDIFS